MTSDTAATADTGSPNCGEVYGTGCNWNGETSLNRECVDGDLRGLPGQPGEVGGSGCSCGVDTSGGWAIAVALLAVMIRRFAPLLLLFPLTALAVDAQHLHVVDGGDYAALMEADQGEAWSGAAWVGVNWGRNLVVLYDAPEGGVLLESVQTSDVGGSFNLGGYARVGVLVPTYANIRAPGPRQPTTLGDLTVWTALPLTKRDRKMRASLAFAGDIPRGPSDYWLGDTHGGATVTAAVEYPAGLFDMLINLGPRFQRQVAIPGGAWGARWVYGAGLRAEPGGPIFLTGELHGAVPVVPWVPVRSMKPLELDGTIGGRIGDKVALSIGGGTGLSRGLGSPSSRILALVDFRQQDVGDRDGDGISDMVDLCRGVPEDFDEFRDADGCPEPDNDRDEIPDDEDDCPTRPETYNGFDDEDGCPDGAAQLTVTIEIADGWFPPETATLWIGEHERTVLIGEPAYARLPFGAIDLRAEALGFQPQQTALVLDERDEPWTFVLQPEPEKVEKAPGAMLDETVRFGEASADLLETALLDELIAYLNDNPELELLRIEGHADPVDTPRYNYELSVDRAESVRDYLIAGGIAPDRLQAIGSGEAIPGDDGGRRVSFTVLIFTP